MLKEHAKQNKNEWWRISQFLILKSLSYFSQVVSGIHHFRRYLFTQWQETILFVYDIKHKLSFWTDFEFHKRDNPEIQDFINLQSSSHFMEKQMATHSSIPSGKIPLKEDPGGLWSAGRRELDMTKQLNNNNNSHFITPALQLISRNI